MYIVTISRDGARTKTADGKIEMLPIGHVIINDHAWRLCLPGFRNAAPFAVPADEATAEKVEAERSRREPQRRAALAMLQRKLNEFAADQKRFEIDPATGKFKRLSSGELAGKLDNITRHVIETAESYGLKPEAPAGKAKS